MSRRETPDSLTSNPTNTDVSSDATLTQDSPSIESWNALASRDLVESPTSLSAKLQGFGDLSKIRVNLLVVFVVAVGYFLGSEARVDVSHLMLCLVPVALLAAGASALNQYIERETDALMVRTQRRPLPEKRLRPFAALAFGLTFGILGVMGLALVSGEIASLIGAGTFLSYVLVYTPLKRKSPHALFVGAVPGALPPLIGWAAASGDLNLDAWAVFAILFVWQVPHFLAIAWLYRKDYQSAGIPTFPSLDENGKSTAQLTIWTTLLLVATNFLPFATGERGVTFFIGAVLLSLLCILPALKFAAEIHGEDRGIKSARRVVHASILYVPLLFLLLVIDKLLG